MQDNKLRLLLASLLVMSAVNDSVIAQTAVASDSLKTMADALLSEVNILGRYIYSPVFFPEIGSDVFVCEVSYAKSGGVFCFATTNGSVRVLEDATGGFLDVGQVFPDEWYVVSKFGEASALVSIPFRRWRDGLDEAGLNVISDISIYRFGGGMVSIAASSSLPGLVCSPDFTSLERLDWYSARRSGSNEWTSTIIPNKVENYSRIDDDPLFGDPTIRGGLQKTSTGISLGITTPADYESGLNSVLSNQFFKAFPTTARVVSDVADTAHTPFVLISTGENEGTDGELWSAYIWDGEQWTQPPSDGFECASGRCPASFRAHTNDFYRLTLNGKPPRLVVLQNREGQLRELFWETALGSKFKLWNFQNGLPYSGYMEVFGLPKTPRSFLQSLEASSPFRRLERVLPRPLSP